LALRSTFGLLLTLAVLSFDLSKKTRLICVLPSTSVKVGH
jgi:hypothetical protein